jgi:competence protein CoiA
MQLYALEESHPIFAKDAEKGKSYTCPECTSFVRVRGGPSRQTHFYHLKAPPHCRQHQKSLEHLHMQLRLLEALKGDGAQMEAPFPKIGRIADVAWASKKIVFEVQCSPISLEEVRGRIADYQRQGYSVIWILHDKQFNKPSLSAAEHHLRKTPCYYTNCDKTGKGLVYD